ncbi:hypothetical protein HBB16_14875 [Pseudonocardia sp. MCCB 268]|nr:hypothetical protein [Pseudonocardia cytotoxica]
MLALEQLMGAPVRPPDVSRRWRAPRYQPARTPAEQEARACRTAESSRSPHRVKVTRCGHAGSSPPWRSPGHSRRRVRQRPRAGRLGRDRQGETSVPLAEGATGDHLGAHPARKLVDELRAQKGNTEADIGAPSCPSSSSGTTCWPVAVLAEQGVRVTERQVDAESPRRAVRGADDAVARRSRRPAGLGPRRPGKLAALAAPRSTGSRSPPTSRSRARPRQGRPAGPRGRGRRRPRRDRAGQGQRHQRGLAIRPGGDPQAALTPLVGIPAGSVAAFPLGSGRGWVVVQVTGRT